MPPAKSHLVHGYATCAPANELGQGGPRGLLLLALVGCRLEPQGLERVVPEPVSERVLLHSDEGRPVVLRTYAGGSDGLDLVLAGVHGSERSAVELGARVEAHLLAEAPRARTTLVVPVLFPDLVAAGQREDARSPTNRNFPPPGAGPRLGEDGELLDAMGRPVLRENLALMELMADLHPDRVLALHATARPAAAGVFADPHPRGPAGRSERAEELALAMATRLSQQGQPELVVGNDLLGSPHALWSGTISGGVSLGGWGPVAIEGQGRWDRPDAMILTVELPGYDGVEGDPTRSAQLEAMAGAIVEVGLR